MKTVNIVHLYAKEMNIYGDNGNIKILSQRLAWRNIPTHLTQINIGDKIPLNTHIIIGGGGQDKGQSAIASDLQLKKSNLLSMRDDGVVMLMICGMYQMFGHFFKTANNQDIPGISILDAYTIAGNKRIIGNIAIQTKWGTLVGYENHSGKTYLGEVARPLGKAKNGQGNNGQDYTEGAVQHNVFGSYLHGPLLAKSPVFADYLIQKSLEIMGINQTLEPINDSLATAAYKVAIRRPR